MPDQLRADVTILTTADSGRRRAAPSIIVVHTNEGPANSPVDNLLHYLADPAHEASYTIVVDGAGRIGRSNDDDYVPWAAGSPANERGLHLCLQGRAAESAADWLGRPAQLAAGARVVADWCRRYGIPAQWLTGRQMAAGQRGIGGHDTTVAAWHSTDHTDPGPGFPRDHFVGLVLKLLTNKPIEPEDDDMAFTDADRKMLREVWDQLRGPGGKGWPQLGTTDDGHNLTPVDKLAAISDDVYAIRNRLETDR